MGRDEYPCDETAAYNLLVNYRTPENAARPRASNNHNSPSTAPATQGPPAGRGITCAQHGAVAGNNGLTRRHRVLPLPQHRALRIELPHGRRHDYDVRDDLHPVCLHAGASTERLWHRPQWILLDSQSTISVFNNASMLTNIRKSDHTLRALTNGGHQDSDMIGNFHNLGLFGTTLTPSPTYSLADVPKFCRVTLDTLEEPSICVHRIDGSIIKFAEHGSGLYVYNSAAQLDLELSRHPDDARRVTHIYGPDVATLKGKTTRTAAAPRAPTFEAVPLPAPVTMHHRNVTLCVDFFVQGICFLHTISRGIGFRTVTNVADRTHKTILAELKAVIHIYSSRGLTVCDIHTDNEFDCVRDDVRPIDMNTVTTDSHVGEIERSIRTIKERLRCCVHGLPFRHLPKIMITHMVNDSVRCLNQFPHATGISATMSPSIIVTGTATPDYNAMRVELGTYNVQVFEDNDPSSNTPRSRSLGAIALCPTGNAQGNYYLMSLATGSRISRHNWTVLPVPDTAIARVEVLALHEGRPLIQDRGLVIEWRPDHPIDDTEYDRDYAPSTVGPTDVFDAAEYDPIEPDELDVLGAPHDDPDPFPDPDQGAAGGDDDDDNVLGNSDEETFDAFDNNGEDDDPPDDDDDHNGYVTNYDHTEEAQAPGGVDRQEITNQGADANRQAQGADGHQAQGADGREAAQTAYYNLRPRAPAHQGFKDAMDMPHDGKSYYPPMQLLQQALRQESQTTSEINKNHYPPTQILQHALRHASRTALETKKRFLENLDVYEPLDPTKLTRKKQKRAAIRALNRFKEKRDGTLKGRTCADGRSQRNLYDNKSQTASTDALLLTIIIDAYEARDVGTADVVGADLKALMDDFVIMTFVGPSVRMLCKLNPDHERFVTMENGVEVLYVRLIKALYGCVKSALLWYELFVGNLKDMGFELNPYDSCVANCVIEGKHCTVAWYVDDTKISHVNPDVVTRVIQELEKRFDKMTVTRGREHTFLGMRIRRYTDENTAVITMKDYLEEAIAESGLDISRPASTPATRTLFEVDDTSEPLSREESEAFHSVSAKLLYVSLRARVDQLLAIAFLCTRVSKSTKQDQSKLKRVLQYIKGTMDLAYTVGADDMARIRTWVDASYAVHPDMSSHTGGTMSFGRGSILCKSSKQKLNTKSSTEAEFVGARDYLPNTSHLGQELPGSTGLQN
ncbi:Reverse transcriptase (RNA-dependent DNA polymerase) [Fragilaria crotonensis]|nr:Reverse transcriptase (RNA-dependent DNA polymerase) [Fragilaria crotonensis]